MIVQAGILLSRDRPYGLSAAFTAATLTCMLIEIQHQPEFLRAQEQSLVVKPERPAFPLKSMGIECRIVEICVSRCRLREIRCLTQKPQHTSLGAESNRIL